MIKHKKISVRTLKMNLQADKVTKRKLKKKCWLRIANKTVIKRKRSRMVQVIDHFLSTAKLLWTVRKRPNITILN